MKNSLSAEKGTYKYIDNRKRKYLFFSILSLLSVLVIFFTGVIIYHSNKSIFSIIAAVSTLPAAKIVISYIIIAPYNSGDSESYEKLNEHAKKTNAELLCDMVITSETKAVFIQYAYIIDGKINLYSNYKKFDKKFSEEYIRKILEENCNFSVLKIYLDKQEFMNFVLQTSALDSMKAMDGRIGKKLLSYSV